MTFRHGYGNSVLSDEGFSIRRLSKDVLEYADGKGRWIHVQVEMGTPLAVYAETVTHWCGADGTTEAIGPEARQRICANIAAALRFARVDAEIY